MHSLKFAPNPFLKKNQISSYVTVNIVENYVWVDLLTPLNNAPKHKEFRRETKVVPGGEDSLRMAPFLGCVPGKTLRLTKATLFVKIHSTEKRIYDQTVVWIIDKEFNAQFC